MKKTLFRFIKTKYVFRFIKTKYRTVASFSGPFIFLHTAIFIHINIDWLFLLK